MKRILLSLTTLLLLQNIGTAQSFENKYVAMLIPDSLRTNASAVIREDYQKFRVKNMGEGSMECHSIVTIFNESASRYLEFAEYSDKFRHLEDAEIKVYNAFGKKLNTYSKKEMQTFAYGDGLVPDGKVTSFVVSAASYPITVEQTYTVKYAGLFDYPTNYIQTPEVATEHFNYVVEVPTNLDLRYKLNNTSLQPKKLSNENTITYVWEANNLKAMLREYSSGPIDKVFPSITISPNKFKYAGLEGDMTTWKNFGAWFYDLIGAANQLSPSSKAIITALVKNATSDEDKAKIIYNYLQQNMRYVSIQLGIGGLKPFAADFVQEKKYGDCKALSNYMQAALNTVGVKSYYAIVNAGVNATAAPENFACDPFNHIILCIPQAKDSIWLECTSKLTDFNVLGNFTENRTALLVTENGGVLVATPKSKAAQNVFTCNTNIALLDDGSGNVATTISSTGEFKFEEVSYLNGSSKDDQIEYFIKSLEWRHPDEFTIANGNRQQTPYVTNATMRYEKMYAFKAGSKMFLQPRLYPLFDEKVNDNLKRAQDYYFSYPYIKKDTTVFVLPQGYVAEDIVSNKTIDTDFGHYERKYLWDETAAKLTVVATVEIKKIVIKAKDYAQLMAFKKDVDADINQRIVVKKK